MKFESIAGGVLALSLVVGRVAIPNVEQGDYAEQLVDMIEAYPPAAHSCNRLIVQGNNVNNYGEVESLARDNCYTILQFDSSEKMRKAQKELSDEGYSYFEDRTIKLSTYKLSDEEEYLSYIPNTMNFDDLALKKEYQNKNITVAVLDSGLAENELSGRVVGSFNAIDAGATVEDEIGHGTQVASVIVDCTADNVSIMPVKVTESNGETTILAVDAAIMFAAEHADIINMSLGYEDTNAAEKSFWNKSIDYAIEKGVPVIVSSGNSGKDTQYVYPACYAPCWTVGALTEYMQRASFSNYGNSLDFVAPGKNIKCRSNDGSNKYVSGTSFATPAISALAAQLLGSGRDYSVPELYSEIEKICQDLGNGGWDKYYGHGIPIAEHIYDKPIFHWNENYSYCSVEQSCINHTQQRRMLDKEIYSEIEVPATCVNMGKTRYTAKTLCDGIAYEDSKLVEDIQIDRNNHIGNRIVKGKIDPTLDKDGYTGDIYCLSCDTLIDEGEAIPKLEKVPIQIDDRYHIDIISKQLKYSGEPIIPKLLIKDESGNTIDTSNYELIFENNLKVGQARVTAIFKNRYSGTISKTFLIHPSPTRINRIIRNGKSVKIKWKSVKKQISGYQIQYSSSKKYDKNVKQINVSKNKCNSKAIKVNSKKRSYYFRIRTYKRIDDKTIYSAWSKMTKCPQKNSP